MFCTQTFRDSIYLFVKEGKVENVITRATLSQVITELAKYSTLLETVRLHIINLYNLKMVLTTIKYFF